MRAKTIKMKNSGIEWIGEIPDDWKVHRFKYVAYNHVTKRKNESFPYIGLENIESYTGKHIKTESEYDLNTANIAFKGDVLFGKLRPYLAKVFLADNDYCVSSELLSFSCGSTIPKFLQYLMLSSGFIDVVNASTYGAKMPRVNVDYIQNLFVAIPNIVTQHRIADYLDKKSAAVDRLIENQQAQIEKLKEYKQSVITEAVTKGLDPSSPLKDSGIEWIGRIPARWQIKRAKYVATSIFKGNGITKEDIVVDGDTPCVRYGEIYSKYNISFSQCKTRTNKSNVTVLQYFHYGDILFAGTGELVEEIGKNIVYLGKEQCLVGGDIIVLRHMQNPAFLNYALYATCSQMQKSCGKAKLKVVHISAAEIGNIYIALPSIIEQQKIANYLDEKCAKIDKLIAIKQQKIETLTEYKKSLIYEYVTGKKQVG